MLLALPDILKNAESRSAQIREEISTLRTAISQGLLTTILSGLSELQSDLKSEVAAELGFSLHDLSMRIAVLEQSLKEVAVRSDLTALNSGLLAHLVVLENLQVEAKNLFSHLTTSLQSRINGLDTQQFETKNLVSHINTSIHTRLDTLEFIRLSEIQSDLKSEGVAAELGFSLHDLSVRISVFEQSLKEVAARSDLAALNSGLLAHLVVLENLQIEAKNLVSHLTTSLQSRLNGLDTQQFETRNLVSHINTSIHTRLDTLEFIRLDGLNNQIHDMTAMQFAARAKQEMDPSQWVPSPAERYQPATTDSLESYLQRAEQDFPRVYGAWRERLDAVQDAFQVTKVGNAAHVGDPASRIFRSFVEMHATGRVLDVGCGIFGRPFYLTSYPGELIFGLDPLAQIDTPDFDFVRGISEYLPWRDESFSTVISATSLDHSLSLERSIDEMWRVLRPGGRLLLWIGSVPGSARYDPDDPAFAPADRYHLFHFDVSWFEPMIEQWFTTIERAELREREFNTVIYCLTKRISRQHPRAVIRRWPC